MFWNGQRVIVKVVLYVEKLQLVGSCLMRKCWPVSSVSSLALQIKHQIVIFIIWLTFVQDEIKRLCADKSLCYCLYPDTVYADNSRHSLQSDNVQLCQYLSVAFGHWEFVGSRTREKPSIIALLTAHSISAGLFLCLGVRWHTHDVRIISAVWRHIASSVLA